MAKRRSRLLISDEVQTSLLFRVTAHWVAFLGLTTVSLAAWIYFVDSPLESGEDFSAALLRVVVPFILCSLAVVPVFLYDIARLSNQFVGPIRRVRLALKQFIENGHYEPVRLRKGDYWQSLANELNTAVEQAMQTQSTAGKSAQTPPAQAEPAAAWRAASASPILADFGSSASTFAATSSR